MDFIEKIRYEEGYLPLYDPDSLDGIEVIIFKHDGVYDWAAFLAFARNGQFYWASGGGCSCNSFGDSIYSVSDLETGRDEELVAAYKRWASEEYNPALTNEERVSAHRDITQAIKDYKKKVKK